MNLDLPENIIFLKCLRNNGLFSVAFSTEETTSTTIRFKKTNKTTPKAT